MIGISITSISFVNYYNFLCAAVALAGFVSTGYFWYFRFFFLTG